MRPVKFHVGERLYAYSQRHADALGIDVETFLTAEIAIAFKEGVLPGQRIVDNDEDLFVTDPGGGVWYEDDLPIEDEFDGDDLTKVLGHPRKEGTSEEEEEALLQELMDQAATWRRPH